MINKKIVVIILSLLMFFSCASRRRLGQERIEEEDLIESFNLDQAKYDKFKVVEKSSPESTIVKKTVEIEKKMEVESISQGKNVEKLKDEEFEKSVEIESKLAPKKNQPEFKKNETLVAVDRPKKGEGPAFVIPEGYPSEYKKYDQTSRPIWNSFSPFFSIGEKFGVQVTYLGLNVGMVEIETKKVVEIANREAYHLQARMISAKYYEYIYSLDDTIDSYIDKEKFLPVKFSLLQRESGQDVDDLQIFDHHERKTHFWYKRFKRGEKKETEQSIFTPQFFQDSFSSLYFVRGLPLEVGMKYEFPILTRAKVWLLKFEVVSKEVIKIAGKDIEAIKVKAETRFPGVLKKKGDILFWYSSDKARKLLKFSAKIKVGTVYGELVHYQPGVKMENLD